MSKDEAAHDTKEIRNPSFSFTSSIHGLRAQAMLLAFITASYVLMFLPLHHATGDIASALTVLPVAVAGWLMGLRMGILAALIFIPVNIALFNYVGRSGLELTVARWPGVASSLVVGVTVGWLSDLLKAVREQSHAVTYERECLAREIAERKRTEEALQEAIARIEVERAKSEAILEAIGDGITIHDTNFRITYQNKTLKNLVGDHLGEYCYQAYRGNAVPCNGCQLALSSGDGGVHSMQTGIQTVNGVLHAEITASLLKDASGKVIAGVEVVRDVSERKFVEDALRQTNETLQTLINGSPLAITLIDAKGNVLIWNPAAERLFGWGEEEVLGRPIPTIPQGEREEFWSMIDAELKGEMRDSRELRRLRKDGSFIDVNSWTELLRGAQGRIIGVIVMFVDITERKRMEEALRKSEERFTLFMRHLTGIAFMRDTEGRYIYVNETWKTVYQRTRPEEWLGRTIDEIWDPATALRLRENDQQVIASRQAMQTVEKLCYDNGEHYWLINRFPILDENGKPFLLGGVGVDITERKKAEESLITYQEELTSLAAELSLAEERERRRIATELHDQLSQNLAFTRMKLNVLEGADISGDVAKSIEEIRNLIDLTIQGIRSLTCQLSPPLLYEVGFEAAVEWLCERFQEEHGLHVEVWSDKAAKPLDEEIKVALFQVVRELLINIAKHAAAGRVEVSVGKADGKLKIIVKDDGAGFDMVKAKAHKDKKCGFGLFNIRQKMAHLGGELAVKSEIGYGTQVTLLAPLKQANKEYGGYAT